MGCWKNMPNINIKLPKIKWTRRNKIIGIAIIALIVAGIVIICVLANRGDKSITVAEDGTKYQTVNNIVFSMNDVKTLNPTISTDNDTYYISKLIYDGLFELDDNLIPQENLAKNYSYDRDENSITINLINTTWHDGKRLTANDVKFTVESYKAAGSKCVYEDQVSAISSVSQESRYKVKIYFNEGENMSLDLLTFPILPSHKYNGTYDVINQTDFKPIGTGPYKYSGYSKGRILKLKANENYHGEKATNSISFEVQPKAANTYRLLEASDLSYMVSTSLSREGQFTQKETKIKDFPANQVEYLGFNFNNDIMAKKDIRKAIAYAIDCKDIIESCYYNSGMINDNIFYPDYMGVKSTNDVYKYNQSKVAKYLKKAGYKDRDDDGFVEDSNGQELNLNLLTSDIKTRTDAADLIKNSLEDVGISVEITTLSKKSYLSYLKAGTFDMFIGGYNYDETMDMREILKGTEMVTTYETDTSTNQTQGDSNSTTDSEGYDTELDGESPSSNDLSNSDNQSKAKETKNYSTVVTNSNYTRYYNSKVNKLLDRLKGGYTNEETKKTFTTLKNILTDEIPYYCLMYKTYGAAKAPALQGDVNPIYTNIYRGCEQWNCKYQVETTNN